LGFWWPDSVTRARGGDLVMGAQGQLSINRWGNPGNGCHWLVAV